MQINEITAQANQISGHQHHYFNAFLSLYDVKGKDILEVGGAMPSSLVLAYLGVNSWTCVQSAEYAQHRSDNQVPSTEEQGKYVSIYGNIEDLIGNVNFNACFDAVFSIACFEHIHKLPQALRVMHQALRPSGKLFSMFSPIWSGPWGQHFTNLIPDRFDAIKPADGWQIHHVFSPWDHLLLSRYQFLDSISSKFDTAFAEELTYITFNSPQINRYFFEDYERAIDQAGFNKLIFRGLFALPSSEYVENAIKLLQARFAYAGYRNFSDAGIVAFLEK